MAAFTTIDDASLFYNTVLYTGNGTAIGSGGLAVTGVGFQPDFTWIKERDGTGAHMLFDSPRGATDILVSNTNAAESNNTESLTTWGADGFTLGDKASVNASGSDYVSFNWKGGTTAVPSGGTITPTACSFSATAGFGIYAYAGNSTAGATIAHGLGAVPAFIICKRLNSTGNWSTYQHKNTAAPETEYLLLNTTAATADDLVWNDTAPTSSVYSLGNDGSVNTGFNYVSYVWTGIQGFSKFGAYEGNGNADGTFVYTGFRPAWIMNKRTNSTAAWKVHNNKVPLTNGNVCNLGLSANTNAAESAVDGPDRQLDFLSNGFKWRATDTDVNYNGSDYIYCAFAESPLVNSEGVPSNSR